MAEMVGSFALLFAGCGAIIVNETFANSLSHVGVSMVFGLIVMVMVYSIGNISGAHINPAVTLGFAFAGRLAWNLVPAYVLSQCLGMILAALLLRYLFTEHPTLGATVPASDLSQVFVMEMVLTFILMFVILNVSSGHYEKGIMAGVAVGGTVALAALLGGPVSGASMNPARSLAPAIASWKFEFLWIYLTAPVIGVLLAVPTCYLIQGSECCRGRQQ